MPCKSSGQNVRQSGVASKFAQPAAGHQAAQSEDSCTLPAAIAKHRHPSHQDLDGLHERRSGMPICKLDQPGWTTQAGRQRSDDAMTPNKPAGSYGPSQVLAGSSFPSAATV